MFGFFKNSLRKRLLVSFIGIALVPFLLLLLYTLYLSETKILAKLVIEQHDKTEVIAKRIEAHLRQLRQEVDFLASLDIMDDLVADDIDKRISRLLSKKAQDIGMDLLFLSIDQKAEVIASSEPSWLHRNLTLKRKNSSLHGSYVDEGYLYIYTDIRASFDRNRSLGFLVLKYDLNNLNRFLVHKEGTLTYLVDPQSSDYVGSAHHFVIDFKAPQEQLSESLMQHDYLLVHKTLCAPLQGWHLVYAVDKHIALEFLYDFIRFMFYILPFILVLIIYLSRRYANTIVRPIEELTALTDNITHSQDYSARLDITSQDETGTLARAFNRMLSTTSGALQSLEAENRVRLKRLTQLIELFNTIIQTKSKKECLDRSVKELQHLTGQNNIHFVKGEKPDGTHASTALYITDFEKEAKVYFGTIVLEMEQFTEQYEQDFYTSIGVMISLQLDRIRLIKRALSASKAKSVFISNMSHELRTPLNSIIGSSQYLLVYEALKDEQQDAVGNIESSAQYLLGMINEILDVAKIEAGKMEVRKEDVDLKALLQNSFSMLAPLASDKELELRLNTEGFRPATVHTDPKLLSQIIINLISNAIKFTVKGAIDISLSHDDTNIYITIKDSGIGIDKKEIEHLFNDFTQIDNELQKSLKGTGLGLSISKKIAQILGGDLVLHSEGLGHGTTAVFSLAIMTNR